MNELKAIDLRIGNIINHTGNDNPHKIDGIKSHNIWFTDIVSHCDYSTEDTKDGVGGIYPEPITEEWLIRMGFSGDDIDRWIILPNGDASELHIEKSLLSKELNIQFTRGDSSTIPGKEHDYVYAGKIKYIHTLQNLYFSLTGKELEIK